MNAEPLVSIRRGNPDDHELAALVAALAAGAAAASRATNAAPAVRAAGGWARSARPHTRPAGWRASGLPH